MNSTRAIDNAKNVEPLQKIPGVFVKEVLPEPCLDVRLTKRTVRTIFYIFYSTVTACKSHYWAKDGNHVWKKNRSISYYHTNPIPPNIS